MSKSPQERRDYQKQYRAKNKATIKAKKRARYEAQRESIIAQNVAWGRANPLKRKLASLKCAARRLGYAAPACTYAEFEVWYIQQLEKCQGRCPCCGEPWNLKRKEPFVDHDHETGALRSLLCNRCNTLEGYGLAILQKAVEFFRPREVFIEGAGI